MNTQLFERFSPVIRSLSQNELSGSPSLASKLRLAQDRRLEICYTPFEYINPKARVVIVGITPGKLQMINAIQEIRRQLDNGASPENALKAAKQVGAFSGAMRPNLINLLDHVGINRWLGISNCESLFGSDSHLVQTTSALRNAVFINGENYNGTPKMIRYPLLCQQLLEGFGAEVQALPQAVFIPLGDKVAEALHFVADQGLLDRNRILSGLPHPSGANAERIAYFLGRKPREELSAKTDPVKLDRAREGILAQVAALD